MDIVVRSLYFDSLSATLAITNRSLLCKKAYKPITNTTGDVVNFVTIRCILTHVLPALGFRSLGILVISPPKYQSQHMISELLIF